MSDWRYRIMSYDEWRHNQTWHGCYSDYVRHMKSLAAQAKQA